MTSSPLFDEIVDRRQINSMKWGVREAFLVPDEVAAEPLPMWVADTDLA